MEFRNHLLAKLETNANYQTAFTADLRSDVLVEITPLVQAADEL